MLMTQLKPSAWTKLPVPTASGPVGALRSNRCDGLNVGPKTTVNGPEMSRGKPNGWRAAFV